MQLHDTEKEGDGERNIRNSKLLMPYFLDQGNEASSMHMKWSHFLHV